MTSIFPPVLENRAPAIDFVGSVEDASSKTLDIHFMMPHLNGVGNGREIKNAQVVVRYKSNNQIAISPAYLPDRATLFYNIEDESDYWSEDRVSGLCTLKVPYACFKGGFPAYNTEYYVQVRFGDTRLWGQPTLGLWYSDLREFSSWHSIQVNAVPSHFGEWSNISTVYCTRRAATELTYNLDDYVPELVWEYRPSADAVDFLEQIQVQWEWDQDDKISQTKHYVQSQVFTGARSGEGNYTFRTKIPIAPIRTITFFVNAVTSHNVIYNDRAVLVCNPKNLPISQGVDCHIETKELSREENNDGIIAKEFYFKSPNSEATSLNLYRYNLNTLECIRIKSGLPAQMDRHYIVKDYTVEMGEEYQYVACLVNQYNKVYKVFEKMTNNGEGSGGYARLMSMEVSFLTTRYHQLRLHGGVSISSFKRNVSETFQTTIGSKYPYYSKNGQQNYRTFALNATISINFDPTFAFIRLRDGIGATWEEKNNSQFIFGEKDIFGDEQFSLSRYRSGFENKVDQDPQIKQLQPDEEGDTFGPKTIYSPFLYKRTTTNVGTSQQDETIFLERKFRELVMSWLSDGKPKLYRSETEGNMIVMLSGVSFTPVQKTQRLIYSMACTVTEIAEYNLENLIEYDLIPSEIISEYKPTGEWDFKPGDYDPMLDHKMKFNVLKSFKIPDTLVGTSITPIDLSKGIVNGVAPFRFSGGTGVGNYLIPGVQISQDGLVFGIPTAVSEPTQVIISVRDSNPDGPTELTFVMKIGRIYPVLEIKTTNSAGMPIKVDGLTVGAQITPVSIGLEPASLGQPPYTWFTQGLPDGLMMKMAGNENQEVVISGAFVYEVQAGTFTLIVEDAYGQVATAEIPYGTSLSELRYLYDSSWDNLPEMEEGTILSKPMEFGKSVVGGVAPFTFTMSPIPRGLNFNQNTGALSGTPSGDTYPVHSTKTTLTVTDATGRSDSVEMIMPTIYARFVFDINDKLLKYFTAGDRGYFSTGTLFQDIAITDEKTVDNLPLVRGGKQFSDSSLPPYIFDCIADTGGILENFGISNWGIIHGYTVASHPAGNITIRATDARGAVVSRKIPVSSVKGDFVINRQPDWAIPTMPLTTPLPANGWLKIYIDPPGFVNNGGEWNDYTITYSDFPPGMTVTKSVENGRPFILISGRLTGVYNKGSGVINVTDGNGELASVTIPIGDIYDTVQWIDAVKEIPDMVVNTRLGGAINLPQISGGLPPYSIIVSDGPPLAPLILTKTNNITASDIVQITDTAQGSGPIAQAARTTVLKARDSRGTVSPQSVVVNIGEVHEAFSVTRNLMPATFLIKDLSSFTPDNTFKIATISGGSGLFTFYYNDKVSQVLPNGLTLNPDGTLSGTPRVLVPNDEMLSNLKVIDNVSGEERIISDFIMVKTIRQPAIHPTIANKLNSDDEYEITGLAIKTEYTSEAPMFDIPISGARLSTENLPAKLTMNGAYYIVGAPETTSNTPVHATAKATLPGNQFTPETSITIKLLINRVSGVLNFRWVPAGASNQGGLAENKPFSLTISDGASGGQLPYRWEIIEGPTDTGLSLQVNGDGSEAKIAGTPRGKRDSFSFKIKLSDANGTTVPTISLSFKGIYEPIKVTTTGLSIAAVNGDQDMNPAQIDLTTNVSGGVPPYSFKSEDISRWGYSLTSQGLIFGKSSIYSVAAGKANIIVSDSVGQTETIEIPVGAVTGQMGLKQTSYNVPVGTRGAAFGTINLKDFILEGTGGAKTYGLATDIPPGWAKEGAYGIELTTDGKITGKYPNQAINTAMSFTVRISDTDSVTQSMVINLPKIS